MYTQANAKWLEENGLALPKMEDRYMAIAIKEWGVSKVLEKMNHDLTNPRFEIGFQFTNVYQRFIGEPYTSLLLFSMDLTFPISQHTEEVKAAMHRLGDVEKMSEDETHVTYSLYFYEGPCVSTMNEVVRTLNEYQGTEIEEKLSGIGITDYRCSFELSKGSE
ncbi:hypothetical protein [Sporosarcina ureae]|uniref:hypothetical protein n=1 Tax=Sporosarcina ureae TaxID=1571 RepID=UPI000A17EB60|nr:hypothetical protein [Sporosarcina ureae]ARK22260.1 hypothetical protein SporoP32a_12425 [Sporosarcina ureae]